MKTGCDKSRIEHLQALLEMQDEKYRDFQSKLMPTVAKEKIIGVRMPQLRNFAKRFAQSDSASDFINDLPHKYYEEDNLHALLINDIKDYKACIGALNDFLPFVDNWASCDMLSPKVFSSHKDELIDQVEAWIRSDHVYTSRFGIEMLMKHYLDDEFEPVYMHIVVCLKTDEYYLKMMKAWYMATALAKHYEAAVICLENKILDKWTHNKTIQKATESRRISESRKKYLKSLRM